MKKTLILLSIFTLISCSKSDENPTQPTTNIDSQYLVNKWDLKSMVRGGTTITMDSCAELYSGYEFKSNNTCIEGYGRVNVSGVCTNNQYNQTYTLVNNILTVRQTNGFEARFYITELTALKLKLKIFYSKEVRNGVTYENNIAENDQTISSYDKI